MAIKKSKANDTELVDISALQPDPHNARRHSVRNLEAIKTSLRRFGQQVPIVVDENNVVLAGNGRLQAAKELGWTEILVSRSRLKGADAVAYSVTDNRSGELAEWDYQALSGVLAALQRDVEFNEDLRDLSDIGWAPQELGPLLNAVWHPAPKPESQEQVRPPEHKHLILSLDEWRTIERAIQKRRNESGNELTDGRCLELIALAYCFQGKVPVIDGTDDIGSEAVMEQQ